MTSLLVTGGLGYIGAHFVWAAADAGARVTILDDRSTCGQPALPPDVAVVTGDLGDAALVENICLKSSVGAVVHFAGKALVGESTTNPALYFDVNVARALRLLDAAHRAGVGRFVFSSSCAIDGAPARVPIVEETPPQPVSPYGASKLAFELALAAYEQAYGLRWAALRYFNAAGADPDRALREEHDPETHLIPLVLGAGLGRRPPLTVFGADYPTPDGTCVRDYVHVCDLAAAHLRALAALETENVGALNLGTGVGVSVRQVIDEAARVVGRPIPHQVGPRRAGDPAVLVADPARARRLLGWAPRRSDLATLLADALRSLS